MARRSPQGERGLKFSDGGFNSDETVAPRKGSAD